MTTQTVSGLDLKLTRVGARVKAKHVADAMGVSASRVAAIEREAIVTPEMARRYVAAVETCRTDRTTGSAA